MATALDYTGSGLFFSNRVLYTTHKRYGAFGRKGGIMPTQEERLSTLEKFQSLAATHIRETEENTTILLGVIREYGRDIKRTFQRLEIIDGRLVSLESDLGSVEGRLGTVESHLGAIEGRLNTLEDRFGTLENRFGTLETGFASQEKKLDQVLLLLTSLTTKPVQETE